MFLKLYYFKLIPLSQTYQGRISEIVPTATSLAKEGLTQVLKD